MKLAIGAFCLICFTLCGFDSPNWHEGSIVLKDGQVKVGELCLQSSQAVLFRANDLFMVYPSYKVKAIYYHDKSCSINRKFLSLEKQSHAQAGFYEIVVWGECAVVRLLKPWFISCENRSDKDDYHYFVKEGNVLTRLEEFRKKIYPTLLVNFPWLNDKVKILRLDPQHPSDAIRIIKLINQESNNRLLASF